MLSDEGLARIEKRCNATTKGPWRAWNKAGKPITRCNSVTGKDESTGEVLSPACHGVSVGEGIATNYAFTVEDDAFVAHAHMDIPYLLAEVKRLKNECAKGAKLLVEGIEIATRLNARLVAAENVVEAWVSCDMGSPISLADKARAATFSELLEQRECAGAR